MPALYRRFPPSTFVSVGKPDGAYPNCTSGVLDGCYMKYSEPLLASRLQQSRFSIIVDENNQENLRITDSLAAGIPAISVWNKLFSRIQNLASACQIPWESMVIGVDENKFQANPKDTIEIVENAFGNNEGFADFLEISYSPSGEVPKSLEDLRMLMDRHAADLLWEAPNSRVISNILTQLAHTCLGTDWLDELNYDADHFQCPEKP
eukprot:GHVO01063016.1.p1 GENE.GHVO01063016.1~~GHVO01063016.1.p1  ORF type:complete len:207 (-),score=17.14 GHVO01063016.1:61-681(-)